jgi:hypothetical protein
MIKLAYRTLLVYSTIVLSTLAFSEIILQIVRPEKLSIAGDVNNENNLGCQRRRRAAACQPDYNALVHPK